MTDTYSKTTIRKFGLRGSPVFEQEEKVTDLDALDERVEETAVPFCDCGAPIRTESDDVNRCCDCDRLCCPQCRIRHSRRYYCPGCARHRFDLDKRTFLTMLFLQHGFAGPSELVDVTTGPDGELIDIAIDKVPDPILEQDYLTEAGTLSAAGLEALHVGRQLFGEDADVQAVVEQIRLQEVVSRA